MKKLRVLYNGWGERWPLGLLADTGREVMFEYSTEAVARGLAFSPFKLPLPRAGTAPAAYRGEPYFHGLPGFVADALPDGWGMLLMDRALRRAGRDPHAVSVLERLAIVGDRAMGALSFEPADNHPVAAEVLRLKTVAQEVADAQRLNEGLHERSHDKARLGRTKLGRADLGPANQGRANLSPADETLTRLLLLGGSPQGARPKVLVGLNTATQAVSGGDALGAGEAPWIIKFPATNEHRETCAIEAAYASAIRACGMDFPQTHFFGLGAKHSAFGAARFDRINKGGAFPMGGTWQRVPMLSLAALLHVDFRLPSLDYVTFLQATLRLTGDQRQVREAFARCVLNVLLHNRDDHARNFAYLLGKDGRWRLSPLFDITFSYGPGGEHAMTVAGEGKHITRVHLMRVAEEGGLSAKVADDVLAGLRGLALAVDAALQEHPVRVATRKQISKIVGDRCKAIGLL
jgi:serine/threonine-protein kinase HipA